MRYFEIAKPSARHVRAGADQREAALAELVGRGIRKPLTANRPALMSNSSNLNRQSRRRHL